MNRKDAWFWLTLTALLCAVGILYCSCLAAARMAGIMG